MLVDYPIEWDKYMIPNERTFVINTPEDIIEKAKELNTDIINISGEPFFKFEEEQI